MAQRKGVMLAYKFEQKKFEQMTKPVIVQPKLNGNRCRAIFDGEGKVTLLSSSEAPIVSMPHIIKQLETLSLKGVELDGELYKHGWRHQKINGIVRRTVTQESEHEQINYCIFDIIDETVVQGRRVDGLRTIDGFVKMKELPNVYVLETYWANGIDEVMLWLSKFMELGYEGAIVRDPTKIYIRKRTNALLKLKPMRHDVFKITGYKKELSKVCIDCKQTPSRCNCEFGPRKLISTPLDTLGAIRCITLEGKEFYVGSGRALTDSTRTTLWASRSELVGRTALVKYQELSIGSIPIHGVLEEITPKMPI